MRKWAILLWVLLLTNCQGKVSENSEDMKGLWQESSIGNVWYFKDSIGYFYLFHPSAEWKLEEDVLKIVNARVLDKDLVIYDEFRILKQTKNKLRLKNDDLSSGFINLQKIDFSDVKNVQGIKRVQLTESVCFEDPECVLTEISINFDKGEVKIKLDQKEDSSIFCLLSDHEKKLLLYLFNLIKLDEFNSEFYSNEVGATYFELYSEFKDSSKNTKLRIDTGSSEPKTLLNFISLAWAISHSSCSQDSVISNRITH